MSTKNEYGVIGAALLDPKTVPGILSALKREDFSDEFGRFCYDFLHEHRAEPYPDILVLARDLEQSGYPEANFLLSEAVKTAIPSLSGEYCRFVREDALKRRLSEIVMQMDVRPMHDTCVEIEDALRDREEEQTAVKDWYASLGEWHDHFMAVARDPGKGWCSTGYEKLDAVLGRGFVNGGLCIIGARPGMGKSTFALNITNRICLRGDAVMYVSLEMSTVQIMSRRIAVASGVSYKKLMTAAVSQEEYNRAMDAFIPFDDKPFYLMDSGGEALADIELAAKKIPGLKCIIIDYLGLITPSNPCRTLYESASEISRGLKMMAKRLEIPVVCLCQLNRQSTQRSDNIPRLSDLRESGAIEQDADAVLLLHRREYYSECEDRDKAESEGTPGAEMNVIVAKNRHGDANLTLNMTWCGSSGEMLETEE